MFDFWYTSSAWGKSSRSFSTPQIQGCGPLWRSREQRRLLNYRRWKVACDTLFVQYCSDKPRWKYIMDMSMYCFYRLLYRKKTHLSNRLMLCPSPSFHPFSFPKSDFSKLDVERLCKRSSPASFWAFGSSTCTNERWDSFSSKFPGITMTWLEHTSILSTNLYKPINGTHSGRQTCFGRRCFSLSKPVFTILDSCCSLGVKSLTWQPPTMMWRWF